MPHTLLLTLAGPMQSWGTRSRFGDRDTHGEPTKSAVIGLLCAACGRGRDTDLSDLTALRMGVRTEKAGQAATDFQTAQRVQNAEGKLLDTVLSVRHYLADARFLVGLSGDDLSFLRTLEDALRNPVWPLALGRRSYPLTLPPVLPPRSGGSVREGVDLPDALREEPWRRLCRGEDPPDSLRLLIEDPSGPDAYSDEPLHFGERRFGLRRVRITQIPGNLLTTEDHPCIYPS